MLDALEELADLSLQLQKADITLATATKLISKQVAVFYARKDSDSEHYMEACTAVQDGQFKGVALSTSKSANCLQSQRGNFIRLSLTQCQHTCYQSLKKP